jgi:hypothetical protein
MADRRLAVYHSGCNFSVAKGFISVALYAFPSSFSPACQCGFSSDFPAPFRSKSFTPSLAAELAQMNCVGSFLFLARACPERYVEGVFKIKARIVRGASGE